MVTHLLNPQRNTVKIYDLLVSRGGLPVDHRSAVQLALIDAAFEAQAPTNAALAPRSILMIATAGRSKLLRTSDTKSLR